MSGKRWFREGEPFSWGRRQRDEPADAEFKDPLDDLIVAI
jgi:hypothetical protein